jgi:DNA-binding NarL/FixJ family response regulator
MIRILIADDHPIVRRGLIEILQERFPGSVLEEASDGEEVIKKVLSRNYHLVICDLSMPGKNGIEVVEQVKLFHPKLPVLILSLHPEEKYALRALKAGAAGYINKEARTDELVNAISHVLSGRKYISPLMAEKLAETFQADKNKEPHELLSNREFHVFKLLAEGKSLSEIAKRLSLNITTISTYRSRLLKKLHLKTNAELTIYALENKFI